VRSDPDPRPKTTRRTRVGLYDVAARRLGRGDPDPLDLPPGCSFLGGGLEGWRGAHREGRDRAPPLWAGVGPDARTPPPPVETIPYPQESWLGVLTSGGASAFRLRSGPTSERTRFLPSSSDAWNSVNGLREASPMDRRSWRSSIPKDFRTWRSFRGPDDRACRPIHNALNGAGSECSSCFDSPLTENRMLPAGFELKVLHNPPGRNRPRAWDCPERTRPPARGGKRRQICLPEPGARGVG
jgi:hypothetical protein